MCMCDDIYIYISIVENNLSRETNLISSNHTFCTKKKKKKEEEEEKEEEKKEEFSGSSFFFLSISFVPYTEINCTSREKIDKLYNRRIALKRVNTISVEIRSIL